MGGMWTADCLAAFRQARAEEFRGPTRICFFGMAVDAHGRLIVQGAHDPKPGFFVSTTSFKNPSVASTSPATQLDASQVAQIVLPG